LLPPSHHAHYVARSRFEVTIDGATELGGQGGSIIVSSGLVHSVVAL